MVNDDVLSSVVPISPDGFRPILMKKETRANPAKRFARVS